MEKYLSEVVNSLNKGEVRQFRKMFERSENPQLYIKLFGYLQNCPLSKLPKIGKKFRSSADYSQAKSDLYSKLTAFLFISRQDTSFQYEKLKWSWEFFFKENQFDLASRAIRIASKKVQKDKLFDKIEEVLEVESALPLDYQPSTSSKFKKFVKIDHVFSEKLSELEGRYAKWAKMIAVPPPSIPAIQIFEQDLKEEFEKYGRTEPAYQNPKQRIRFLSMLKKTLILNGKFSEARKIQETHLEEIEHLNIPLFKKETLKVDELKNQSALFQIQENHHEFEANIRLFSSLNFVTPKGKALSILHLHRLIISYSTEYGLIENSGHLLAKVPLVIDNFGEYLTEGKLTTFKYIFGKYLFICGQYSKANRLFATIFDELNGSKAYSLFFPYVTLIQIIIASLDGEDTEGVSSKILALQRFLKNEKITYKYFEVFQDIIPLIGPKIHLGNPILPAQRLYSQLLELQKDSFEGFPFSFFDLSSFVKSLATGKPFSEVLEEKLENSPKPNLSIAFGGK